MKYVTPTLLIVILLASTFKPSCGWDKYVQSLGTSSPEKFEWASDSMVGKLLHRDVELKPDATPEELTFNKNLKITRTADRLMMLASFAGFGALVWIARKRRSAEERTITT